MSFKKRDRVSFTHPNTRKTAFGVVTKGGAKKIEVMADGQPDSTISGPVGAFLPCNEPLPSYQKSDMDRWSVTEKVHKVMMNEGQPVETKFFLDGKHMFSAIDEAQGGPITITPAKGQPRDIDDQFMKQASEWIKLHTGLELVSDNSEYTDGELRNIYVTWFIHYSWTSITPAEIIRPRAEEAINFKKRMEEVRKERDKKHSEAEKLMAERIEKKDFNALHFDRFEEYSHEGPAVTFVDRQTGRKQEVALGQKRGFLQALEMIAQ